MCYICSCFANCLDLLQRLITFGLACILCGSVCFGLTIAIIAGIAYGYNYCMAEFITFTRSDVTVYMRRGQFYDKPDLPMQLRRSGGGEEDLFGMNRTTDYEEPAPAAGKPLSDTWMKSQDTRKYAEMLTKYSPPTAVENLPQRTMIQDPVVPNVHEAELPPVRTPSAPISMKPNKLISTVSWRSGISTIVMRNFKPMQEISQPDFGIQRKQSQDIPTSPEPVIKSFGFIGDRHKNKGFGGSKLRIASTSTSHVPLRTWSTGMRPIIPEYITEEVDEDNIVYKPV